VEGIVLVNDGAQELTTGDDDQIAATPVEQQSTTDTAAPESDLAKVRNLILTAFSDLVPELVGGETVDDLLASVDLARKAYAAVVEHSGAKAPAVPSVPAGGNARTQPVSMSDLSPSAKIAEGLRHRAKRS
jgi:hypothetical protein